MVYSFELSVLLIKFINLNALTLKTITLRYLRDLFLCAIFILLAKSLLAGPVDGMQQKTSSPNWILEIIFTNP